MHSRGSTPPRLNPAQRDAVEHGEGPLLVLAGAGSGKTRVITHRIARAGRARRPAGGDRRAHLHQQGRRRDARARRDDARQEALGRRLARSPSRRSTPSAWACSSASARPIGRHLHHLRPGRPDLARQAAPARRRAPTGPTTRRRSSRASRTPRTPSSRPRSCPTARATPTTRSRKVVYPRYQAALRQYKAFDFDDLVCEVARALAESGADVRARWQERFLHVLVDEYQDTNRAQLELLRLLCGERRNVCAVGDDDQAIYGWRGADVRNILDFERHFPGARVVKLEQNYRSRAPILEVANAVIAKRTDAKWRKVLFTERAGGEQVHGRRSRRRRRSRPPGSAGEIRRLLGDEGKRARDVAVLYRSNGQSQARSRRRCASRAWRTGWSGGHAVLRAQGGEGRPRVPEARAQPDDEISLRRVINYPARGIGETSLERLALHALAPRVVALAGGRAGRRARRRARGRRATAASALEEVVGAGARELFGAKRPPSEVARAIVRARGAAGRTSPRARRRVDAGGQALGERRGGPRDARPARGRASGPNADRAVERSSTRSPWTSSPRAKTRATS